MRLFVKVFFTFFLINCCYSVIVTDNFDDEIIDDTLWAVMRSSNTEIDEFGGYLRERVNFGGCGGSNVCYVTTRMKKSILGDFDASFRFHIEERGYGDVTPVMLIATNDCIRQRVATSWVTNFGFNNYRAEYIDSGATDTVWAIRSSIYTGDTLGHLRLKKVGDMFYF